MMRKRDDKMINREIRIRQNEDAVSAISKLFSIFMALYPVLCIYKAFFKFTIGDIILIFFFFISCMRPIKKDSRMIAVFIFAIYAFLSLSLNIIFSQVTATYLPSSLFFRLIKFIFYMLCVFTCGQKFFNLKIFQKTILILAGAACFYMFFQYFMYYVFGKIALGRIPGLALYLDEYSIINYEKFYSYSFRPSSFFLEPALFCQYTIVALILILFTNKLPRNFNRVFMATLLTSGILISTSGQGILYLTIVYAIFGFIGIKKKGRIFLFAIFIIVVALVCYYKIEAVQYAVDRLLYDENASEARLGTYKYCFSLTGFDAIFGYGYGVTPGNEYMAGAAYVWYGGGIIGLILAVSVFISFYGKAHNITAKIICFIFFVMFLGTGLFYNYMLCWYFTIILCTSMRFIEMQKGETFHEHSVYSRRLQAEGFS